SQTFNDSVTLGATTTLLSTGSGDISFASTLDSDGSSRDLRLTARGGDITFGGNVGQSSPLSLVTVFTAVNVNNFGNTFNANFLQTSGTGTTSLASVGTDTYDVTTFNIDLPDVRALIYIRLNSTGGGAKQQAAAVLQAPNLDLEGTGDFLLDHAGNNITTLSTDVNGKVAFFGSNNAFTVGTFVGPSGTISGIRTSGHDLDLDSGENPLTITQRIDVGNAPARLFAKGDITQTGAGTITANA